MASKNAEAATAMTPTPRVCRSKNIQDTSKYAENFNPNVSSQQPQPQRSPVSKPLLFSNPDTSSSSPAAVSKSCSAKKSQKPIKNPNNTPLVVNKIRQRKFVVAKKKQKEGESDAAADAGSTASFCKCKDKSSKCLCVAYHNLRKSQEEFFNNRPHHDHEEEEATETETENQSSVLEQGQGEEQGGGKLGNNGVSLLLKRSRESSVPQSVSGSGKVMNLVKAFEKLLSVAPDNDHDQKEEEEKETREKNDKVVMKWPPPKLQQQLHTAPETGLSGCSSFCPPNFTLTSQNLGLDHPRASVSSSWDNNSRSISS